MNLDERPEDSRRLPRQGCTRDQFGSIVAGAFTPVLAKHSKSFSLMDARDCRFTREELS